MKVVGMWNLIYRCKHTFLPTYQKIRAQFKKTKKWEPKIRHEPLTGVSVNRAEMQGELSRGCGGASPVGGLAKFNNSSNIYEYLYFQQTDRRTDRQT